MLDWRVSIVFLLAQAVPLSADSPTDINFHHVQQVEQKLATTNNNYKQFSISEVT